MGEWELFHSGISSMRGALVTVTALTGLLGCGEALGVDAGDPAERVADTTEAISSTHFTDGSGTIQLRVKTCDYVASQVSGSDHIACAFCPIEPGWARVGGGAEILGESTPGAQLVASRADWTGGSPPTGCSGGGTLGSSTANDVWIARSRGGVAHQLRAYVVGMRIRNSSGTFVAPSVSYPVDRTTPNVAAPATASVRVGPLDIEASTGFADALVVAGGAEIVPNNANAYLTSSAPVTEPGGVAWEASSRFLGTTLDGSGVKAWVIGVERCPAAWGGKCFTAPSIRQTAVAATDGYGTASFPLPASWVSPVVGGRALSGGGGGRYLADLIPFYGSGRGATARSKRGIVADSGATQAFAVAFGRADATYTFNSVRFNGIGFSLSRPNGTNPRLQQSPTAGNAPELRWHLEPLNGSYRLRNGNPDSGAECAYRVAGTTEVRVTTCGTGNEFLWDNPLGTGYDGIFLLRNVSSGLCLDNQGATGPNPSNLVLSSCSPRSGRQALYLDAFSWPPP
jgi:hypothetical protein